MTGPSRRDALRFGGAALAAGLAGCAALDGGFGDGGAPDSPRIVSFDAVNHDEDPHSVHALLVADGEPTYWETVRLAGDRPDDATTPGARFRDHPPRAGTGTLYAWRDEQPRERWSALAVEGDLADAPCLGVSLRVGTFGDGGSDPPDLTIWYATNCREGSGGDGGNGTGRARGPHPRANRREDKRRRRTASRVRG